MYSQGPLLAQEAGQGTHEQGRLVQLFSRQAGQLAIGAAVRIQAALSKCLVTLVLLWAAPPPGPYSYTTRGTANHSWEAAASTSLVETSRNLGLEYFLKTATSDAPAALRCSLSRAVAQRPRPAFS